MDERNMLEQIRRSASHIEAPESLKPEQIEELVQGKAQKSRRLPIYRLGAAAAVLFLVFAVLWQTGPGGVIRLGGDQKMEAETSKHTEGAELAAETAADAEEAEILTDAATDAAASAETECPTTESAEEEVIPHIKDERELYLALADMVQTRDMGGGLATGTAKYAAAEDGAVPAEAKEEEALESAETVEADSAADSGDYSRTNLQETGVDEGDIVKTDGSYIYVLSGSKLCIVKADGGTLAKVSEIELPNRNESVEELYLDGDTLVFIAGGSDASLSEEDDMADVYYISRSTYTKAYTYDISDRSAPKLAGSITQEGYYRTSRKNGDKVYLFTEYTPEIKDTQESSTYMPRVEGEALAVKDVYLPEYAARSDYLVISSVDVKEPGKVIDHKAIVSAAEMFYVSTENIYISGYRYENGADYTQILKFSYRDGQIRPAAVGEIKGYVNDSFSLNESKGYLRVVAGDWSGSEERTHLYVLDEDLEVCGKIEDLAPGESIRSARFLGDAGYFVTFRDTDPLFSVDLGNPEEPKILGELKITGFSSYLHFYGENKLLGIGNEVDPETGEYQGIKLSMFDISDPADVKEIDRYVIRDSYDCPGIYNYKAIMVDPEKNIFGFACENNYLVFSYDGEEGFVNRFLYELRGDEDSYIYNGDVRGIYIGKTFYLSDGGSLKAFDMEKEFEKTGELSYQ